MTPLGTPLPDDHPDRVLEDRDSEIGLLERGPGPGGPDRWLYRTVRAEGVTRA